MIVLNENIKGLKVGTKMIGNWGAMIPLSYGTVTDVIRDYKGVDVEVTIEWDDLKETTYWTSEINKCLDEVAPWQERKGKKRKVILPEEVKAEVKKRNKMKKQLKETQVSGSVDRDFEMRFKLLLIHFV